MIENWQIPLLMTFLAGLATILGGFITFFVNKNNMKVLSLGLGFSAGVMIFVALTEIMHSAQDLLVAYFPNNYKWMVFAGFIIGVLISKLIDTFVPDHVEEDLPANVRQLSVAPLLGQAISRIHDDESVSSLFGFEKEMKV